MDRPEYVIIILEDIPQKFIDEYNLIPYTHNGWIYFEIIKVCYGLPQARKLANDLLRIRINENRYYETTTTPGLWCHKWCPIMFVLIVDGFGIEYVGDQHLNHLRTVLTPITPSRRISKGKHFLA